MGLDWKSLPYGHFGDFALNPIKDSKSRRRRSLGPDQSNFLNQHITPSAGDAKGAVPAVVYRSRLTKHKRSNDKAAMKSPESGTSFKNYIYNVYYHGGAAYPAPSSEDDPLVAILPEATLDTNALSSMSMFGNAANNFDLTSRMVMVTFDQPYSQTGARITRVGTYVDLNMYASRLSSTFVQGATGGGGGAMPGVGDPGDYQGTPAGGWCPGNRSLADVNFEVTDEKIVEVVWEIIAAKGRSKSYHSDHKGLAKDSAGDTWVGVLHWTKGALEDLYKSMDKAGVVGTYFPGKTLSALQAFTKDGDGQELDTIWWKTGMTSFLDSKDSKPVQNAGAVRKFRRGIKRFKDKYPFQSMRDLAIFISLINSKTTYVTNFGAETNWDPEGMMQKYCSHKKRTRCTLIQKVYPLSC